MKRLNIEQLERRLQLAGASSGFVPYPITITPTNTTQVVNVLVVNYDPLVPSQGNKHLWEVFTNWNNPRTLATQYVSEMEYASGGALKYNIIQWRDVNDIPVLTNGYDYTPDEYYRNTTTGSGWQPSYVFADFNKIAASQDLATPINSGTVDEVWLFGEHYFMLMGETWMAGPGHFYVNGPEFDYPALNRAFVGTSFDYGRGVAEMMHNTAHRLESTMAYYGYSSDWVKFTSNYYSNGVGGVGNCHFPANGQSDYNYDNPNSVYSTANDWANYPNLTGATTLVSRDAWTNPNSPVLDYHKDYLAWFYGHLPRASGTVSDGRQANWWKYLYDFNDYTSGSGLAKDLSFASYVKNVNTPNAQTYTFTVTFSSAYNIDLNSVNNCGVVVSGQNGLVQTATLLGLGRSVNYVVATYKITAPGGYWDAADNGTYNIIVNQGIKDAANRILGRVSVGSFGVSISPTVPGIPTKLIAIVSGTQVNLYWSAPSFSGNLPIRDYVIKYSVDYGKTWLAYVDGVSNRPAAVIKGLRKNTVYMFAVSAVNSFGVGASARIAVKI